MQEHKEQNLEDLVYLESSTIMAENSASAACERLAPATTGVGAGPGPGAGAGVPAETVIVAACATLARLVCPTALRLVTTELFRLATFTLGCALPATVKIAFTPVLERRRWL